MSAGSGSFLTIDTGAIADNYRTLRTKAGTECAGVVKANAYGLGVEAVVPALSDAGCREFFVAQAREGIAVRALAEGAIYVLGGIHTGTKDDFTRHKLIPVLNSLHDIAAWEGPCVLHFDTGMNRLGLSAAEADMLEQHPELLSKLDVVLAMSHFACSDEKDHTMNAAQVARFENLRARFNFPRWSLANSSGIFRAPCYDLARPGFALYGGNPTPEAPNPMKPVVRLDARILQLRDESAGETIGYGATYKFTTRRQTATLGFGYADGFHRAFAGAQVYFDGRPCPVLGRISMDLICVDVTHLPESPMEGGLMEVLGPHQSIDQLAHACGTIGYEVLTSLGMRYARLYI